MTYRLWGLREMQRTGVTAVLKRRQPERVAAELQRRKKMAVAIATSAISTSASGAIVMITMAAFACGH
jgi:hypothetical protein